MILPFRVKRLLRDDTQSLTHGRPVANVSALLFQKKLNGPGTQGWGGVGAFKYNNNH
jgi:hypothetical protein